MLSNRSPLPRRMLLVASSVLAASSIPVVASCSASADTVEVSLPPPVSPSSAAPVVSTSVASPAMAELKAVGALVDAAVRGFAARRGVSPSMLSADELEIFRDGFPVAPPAVLTVVRGRLQVSVASESICLLLPGDSERPAFMEERPCG